jgi:hypothetical protein
VLTQSSNPQQTYPGLFMNWGPTEWPHKKRKRSKLLQLLRLRFRLVWAMDNPSYCQLHRNFHIAGNFIVFPYLRGHAQFHKRDRRGRLAIINKSPPVFNKVRFQVIRPERWVAAGRGPPGRTGQGP